MSNESLPQSEIILYQTEDGRTRVQCRFENETVWLTQQHMAELFQTSKQNVSLHIHNIFAEGELREDSVVKESLTTAADGNCCKICNSSNRGRQAGDDKTRALKQAMIQELLTRRTRLV